MGNSLPKRLRGLPVVVRYLIEFMLIPVVLLLSGILVAVLTYAALVVFYYGGSRLGWHEVFGNVPESTKMNYMIVNGLGLMVVAFALTGRRRKRIDHEGHRAMDGEAFVQAVGLPAKMDATVIALREALAGMAKMGPSQVCPGCDMRDIAERVRPVLGDGFDAMDLVYRLERKLGRAINMSSRDFPTGLDASVKQWFEATVPALEAHFVERAVRER